jgi:hypothetical protein
MTKYLLAIFFALCCVQNVNAGVNPIQAGASSSSSSSVWVGTFTRINPNTASQTGSLLSACLAGSTVTFTATGAGSHAVRISAPIALGSTDITRLGFLKNGLHVAPFTSDIGIDKVDGAAQADYHLSGFAVVTSTGAGAYSYCVTLTGSVNGVTISDKAYGHISVEELKQ